jgi:type I restriction enzyme S subunit
MTWKVYSEYKESGIEWLRQIPAHWEISTLRRIGRFSASGIDKKSVEGEMSVHMVNYTNIYGNKTFEINSSNNLMETTAPMEKLKEHQILCGDIMFTPSSETTEEIGLSAVVMENIEKTVYSYHVIRFRTTVVLDLRFKKYFCNHPFIWSQFSRASKGTTRQILTREDFKNIVALIPPFDEQRAIANFLDRETERIDTLIAKKERQIELLQEKRAALISHVVTKGLNPNVKMKDSGIEWLGEIPQHWELKRVKHMTRILRGKFTHRPRNDPRMYDGPYPFIQTGDVSGATKYIREYHQTLSEDGFAVSKMFPKGTLVMTIAANIGDMAILDFEACFPDSIVGFVPSPGVELDFLYYLFVGIRPALLSAATLNTQFNLNIDRIGSVLAVHPPSIEQRAIFENLENKVGQVKSIIDRIRGSITTLREYRTALISAAVTGKIDVREEVA